MDNKGPNLMNEFCSKCNGAGTKNNILLPCDYKHCLRAIHDNCNSNPILIDGENKFVCNEHLINYENSIEITEIEEQSETKNTKKSDVIDLNNQKVQNTSEMLSNNLANDSEEEVRSQGTSAGALNKHDNITKRKPSNQFKKYDCVMCKDQNPSTSDEIVTCVTCDKTFHLTCQLQHGELKVKNKIIVCHYCNPLNYIKNNSHKMINENSINTKNDATKNDATKNDANKNDANKNARQQAHGESSYRKHISNYNNNMPQRNLSSKRIHFKNNDNSTESETSSEGQYKHSTPTRNQRESGRFREKFIPKHAHAKDRNSFIPPAFEIQDTPRNKNNKNSEELKLVTDVISAFTPMISFVQKANLAQLPQVDENVLAWDSFYRMYLETSKFFTLSENMNRVKQALKNKELRNIGGHSLDDMYNFEKALADIDKRLEKKDSVLLNVAIELKETKKIKDDDFQAQLELMDKIIDFENLIMSNNDKTYNYDQKFMLELIHKFPIHMYNKWTNLCVKLKENRKTINFGNLAFLMRKELSAVQIKRDDKKIYEDLMNENKKSYSKPYQKTENKEKMWLNHNSEIDEESYEDHRVNYNSKDKLPINPELVCWKHQNAKHKYNKCKLLWELSGRTVKAMAQEANRCTICGMKKHDPCPNQNSLKCIEKDCNGKHHALYCERRVGDREKRNENQNNMNHFVNELNDERNEEEEFVDDNLDNEIEHFSKLFYTGSSQVEINNNHGIIKDKNDEENSKFIIKRSSDTLLGCIVVRLENGKPIALLVDSGSSLSLIEEEVANELGLTGPSQPLILNWTGGHQRIDENSRRVAVKLRNMDNSNIHQTIFFRTDKNLKMGSQRLCAKDFEKYSHLKNLKLHDYEIIQGIIGVDNLTIFADEKTFKGQDYNQPLGISIPLGDYIVHCKFSAEFIYKEMLNNKHSAQNEQILYNYSITQEEKLEYETIEKQLIENLETPDCVDDRDSYEDELALKILDEQVYKDNLTGHYYSPFLWKENFELDLTGSEALALYRFKLLEKIKHDNFGECEEQIRNLLEKNYAAELTENEILQHTKKSNYVPIFFINPKNKRLRLIWDMKAQVKGKSINDALLRGPNFYNDILKIQMQMCEHKILIKGDLKEMFHQIRLIDEDTDAVRFLFRFKNETNIRHFKMLVLPFGAKCSPTIAQYVKNRVAKENINNNPVASDLMMNSTYVDDIVTSLSSESTAAEILIDLKKNFYQGGFEMMKINSNSQKVINMATQRMLEHNLENTKNFSEAKIEKILGYTLDFENDTISVVVPLDKLPDLVREFQQLPTKRQVLQMLMSIYDPKGYFQFITSDLKILYKKILDLEWDSTIPEELKSEWTNCILNVDKIKDVKLPRLYCKQEYDTVELHAFGDAGINILCGIIFARFLFKQNQVGYSIIYAKTFIVPRKPVRTIPELELHMARNLINMVSTVIKNHRIQFEKIYYYTDNTTVLEWISNGAKKMTQYQQNRLKTIKEENRGAIWRWISTDKMPADLGTKKKILNISYDNLWFKPEILEKNLLDQESQFICTHVEAETENSKFIELDKYSKYFNMINKVQIYCRFFEWVKKVLPLKKKLKIAEEKHQKSGIKNGNLKRQLRKKIEKEMKIIKSPNFGSKRATKLVLLIAQKESMMGFSLNKHPELINTLPYIDAEGLIRTQNRLPEDSNQQFVIRRLNSIWLPKNHHVTKLIVMHYHECNKHILIKNVVAAVENKYYIHRILSTVKKITKNLCMWCKRFKPHFETPLMGDLPESRIGIYELPFTYSMLDIAGPIVVKLTRFSTVKRYILVYSCLTTRAVYLELIQDLSADSTMKAINNIINRVGAPAQIITDNGTNFIGSNSKFIELTEHWNKKLIEKNCIIEPIEWRFGPARAPHFQGSVERMVGLTKRVMKSFLQMMETTINKLDDFTITNMLTEIMGILNSRPLSMVPLKEGGHELLTPNSFLMRRPNPQCIPYRLTDKAIKINDFQSIKESHKPLWEHFIRYYLPTITKRPKWNKKIKKLEVGDVVVTVDTTVGNSWRLGTIIKINPGSKDQVRSVEIKLGKREVNIQPNYTNKTKMKTYLEEKSSIVTRPTTAVARLDISNN